MRTMEAALLAIDFFRQMHGHYRLAIERFQGRTMLLDALLQGTWPGPTTSLTNPC